MGAGASVPTSEEEAIAAGYTKEQIDDWVSKNATPAEAEAGALKIQAAAAKRKERAEAKMVVEAQKSVNKIGEAIAAAVPLAVQKMLHSAAFPNMCSAIFADSDADKSGTLEVSELGPAMTTVLTTMSIGEDTVITQEQAEGAMSDFDMDKNKSLDQAEFLELARVLILATLIKEPVKDTYKYLLAANAAGMGKDGGLPTKPLVSGSAEATLGSAAAAEAAPAAEEAKEEAPPATVPTKEATEAEAAAAAVMETFGDIDGSPEQQTAATRLQAIQRKKEAKKIVEAKKAEKAATVEASS